MARRPECQQLLEEINHYLKACFRSRETPRVSELSQTLGVSREWISRSVREHCGLSVSKYLKREQLAHAQELLRDTELLASDVAARSGYGTVRTLQRARRADKQSDRH